VLANGGSQGALLFEGDNLLKQGVAGSKGVDLNGDGDFLDTVLVGRPSITNTKRITVISSLVWKPDSTNTFRIATPMTGRITARQVSIRSRTTISI
jgi:hypothetical protein